MLARVIKPVCIYHVCVHLCVCVCMHMQVCVACVCVWHVCVCGMCVCVYVWHVCVCVCVCTTVCLHVCLCLYARASVCEHVCVWVCVVDLVYTHIHPSNMTTRKNSNLALCCYKSSAILHAVPWPGFLQIKKPSPSLRKQDKMSLCGQIHNGWIWSLTKLACQNWLLWHTFQTKIAHCWSNTGWVIQGHFNWQTSSAWL